MKKNCWQYKSCGREPGGLKSKEMGVCAAAIAEEFNGKNSGLNGGRMCWSVAGTLCGGVVQGTYAEKRASCLSCEFFQCVKDEEGTGFRLMPPGQNYTRSQRTV